MNRQFQDVRAVVSALIASVLFLGAVCVVIWIEGAPSRYADPMTALLFSFPFLTAFLAAGVLYGAVSGRLGPGLRGGQFIIYGVLCCVSVVFLSLRTDASALIQISVDGPLVVMGVASVVVGRLLIASRPLRGAAAMTVATVAAYVVFSFVDHRAGYSLIFLPLALGVLFGLIAGLIARGQWQTQLIWGGLVGGALYMPYMFLEGVPLIVFMFPVFGGIFMGGVCLSQRFLDTGHRTLATWIRKELEEFRWGL